MFVVNVDKVITSVQQTEEMTSGSKNIFVVNFNFSKEWLYLQRTAVFRANETVINVLLDDDNRCMIPWEVMVDPSIDVEVGCFGVKDDVVVMPTTWANIGTLLVGVTTGLDMGKPTPDVYQQLLSRLDSVTYEFGHGFEQIGNKIIVKTVDNFSTDNTLPMSAAGVESSLGNIEILLKTI